MNLISNQKNSTLKIGWILLLAIYGFLFYLFISGILLNDFASFYSASQISFTSQNPYIINLYSTFLSTTRKIPPNLNPPTFLWMVAPLAHCSYFTALSIWYGMNLVLGTISAGISLYYAFSVDFIKTNWAILLLIYWSLFSVLSSTLLAQTGILISFFVMFGYVFYQKNNDYLAGFLWGTIISIKLFPGLLFIFALIQRRYRACTVMLTVFIFINLMTCFIYGTTIYYQYISMLQEIYWYGINWNASILGYMVRVSNGTEGTTSLLIEKILYPFFSLSAFCYYLFKLKSFEKHPIQHQSFSITLIMMLLLSPFGWQYYFPVLILPLALTWITATRQQSPHSRLMMVWILCFFLVNFPIPFVRMYQMPTILGKLSLYSFHFYGLLLLLFLLTRLKKPEPGTPLDAPTMRELYPIVVVLSFSLFVLLCWLIKASILGQLEWTS